MENSQAGMLGLGWDLSSAYISRSYGSCSDDGETYKGDLCWMTKPDKDGVDRLVELFSIVLNGHSSELVPVAGHAWQYRLANDPAWRVELISDAHNASSEGVTNADNNNEGFKVRTPDGTVYWFGKRGNTANSVWTVPVYGNDAGEPCHNSSSASGSWCQQGWRWNLDKVVDSNGNVTKYFYSTETNYYGRWGSSSNTTVYDRAGYLTSIEYGFPGGGSSLTGARQRVDFGVALRCKTKVNDESQPCQPVYSDPSDYPDVPTDLRCTSGSACTNYSPSFFTTHRYTDVTTSIVKGASNSQRLVDNYVFDFSFPYPDSGFSDSGDTQDLWLKQVQRTGYAGDGSTETMTPVKFQGVSLQNRVAPGTDLHLRKFRVDQVTTELGGLIQVTYGHDSGHACDGTYTSGLNQWESTKECFPQRYAPDGGTPQWLWFHKYMVTRIALGDVTLGYDQDAPASYDTPDLGTLRVYDYDYRGDPAWRYRQGPLHPDADETWNDWRGYEETYIHTRAIVKQNNSWVIDSNDVALQRVVVFRGMNNSLKNNSGGSYNNVQLNTEEYAGDPTNQPLDRRRFQGKVAESESLRPGGTQLTRVYHDYVGYQTADNPWGARPSAFVTAETRTLSYARVNGTDNTKRSEVDYTVDDGGTDHLGLTAGLVTQTLDRGLPDYSDDNVCSTQTYWANDDPDVWMIRPRLSTTYQGFCSNQVVTAQHTNFYDAMPENSGSNSDLVHGNLTHGRTWSAAGVRTDFYASYDTYGRVKQTTDDRDLVTDTVYNPGGDDGDVLSGTQVTLHGPNGDLVTTTDLFARRGLPTGITDANNNVTDLSYDGLGRLVGVVLPGNNTTTDSMSFTYSIDAQNPSVVSTQTLVDDSGNTTTSYAYLDGWGRQIQTQIPQQNGGRIISTAAFNELGQPAITIPEILNGQDPGSSFFNPIPDNQVQTTRTNYDAVGRPTLVSLVSDGVTEWSTDYTYYGDRTVVVPPGKTGAETQTVTYPDSHGRPITIDQYLDGAIDTEANYTYTPDGQIATIKSELENQAGNPQNLTWTYTYDWKGRRVSTDDPDTGITTTSYDDTTRTATVDTAADLPVATTVDILGRPVQRVSDPAGTPTTLATWTYDTATGGLGQLASVMHHNANLGDITKTIDTYDVRGRPTQSTTTFPADWVDAATSGGNPVNYTVGVEYNQMGQITTTSYPAIADLPADTVATTYDPHGFYTSNTSQIDGTVLGAATYNNRNQITELDSDPVTVATVETDAAMTRTYSYASDTDRLIQFTVGKLESTSIPAATTWLDEAYTYDAIGNPTRVQDNTRTNAGVCYSYDNLSRLSHAATASIDANGVCTDSLSTSVSDTPYQFDYGYAPQGGALTSVTQNLGTGPVDVTYNYPTTLTSGVPVHGLTSTTVPGGVDPTTLDVADGSITYDTNGRIATWTDLSGGSPGIQTDYTYDPEGNLKKTSPDTGTGLTTKNAYDDAGIRVARRTTDDTGAVTTTVFLGATELTTVDTGSTTATRTYTTAGGTLLGTRDASGITWLAADRLNNIRLTRGANGADGIRHDYTPYGQPLQTVDTLPNQRGYLDKTHDPSGDIRLDHRAYNPDLGVLTTPDPLLTLTDPQNLNPYTYARNNPITFIDPTGLMLADPVGDELPFNQRQGDGSLVAGMDSLVGMASHEAAYAGSHPGEVLTGVARGMARDLDGLGDTISTGTPLAAPLHNFYVDHGLTFTDLVDKEAGLVGIDPNSHGVKQGEFAEAVGSIVAPGGAAIDVVRAIRIEREIGIAAETGAGAVQPYEVGTFNELRSRSVVGDGLDLHHVPQTQPAAQVIPGYTRGDAPAIALPAEEHGLIPNLKGPYSGTPADLVARDVGNLREYTGAPESSISKLLDLIGRSFPESF